MHPKPASEAAEKSPLRLSLHTPPWPTWGTSCFQISETVVLGGDGGGNNLTVVTTLQYIHVLNITLYTLNSHDVTCRLIPNKAGAEISKSPMGASLGVPASVLCWEGSKTTGSSQSSGFIQM